MGIEARNEIDDVWEEVEEAGGAEIMEPSQHVRLWMKIRRPVKYVHMVSTGLHGRSPLLKHLKQIK
jgi:hypothetical protein